MLSLPCFFCCDVAAKRSSSAGASHFRWRRNRREEALGFFALWQSEGNDDDDSSPGGGLMQPGNSPSRSSLRGTCPDLLSWSGLSGTTEKGSPASPQRESSSDESRAATSGAVSYASRFAIGLLVMLKLAADGIGVSESQLDWTIWSVTEDVALDGTCSENVQLTAALRQSSRCPRAWHITSCFGAVMELKLDAQF